MAAAEIDTLIGNVPARYSELTFAERAMLESSVTGMVAVVDQIPPGDSGIAAHTDVREQRIRADLLRWLITDGASYDLIHPRGVQVQGAYFVGRVDLEGLAILFHLSLMKCRFDNDIVLRGTANKGVRLSGSQVANIYADNMLSDGNILMDRGFHSNGEVTLHHSHIRGNLECDGGKFDNAGQVALFADRIEVSGGVFFRDGFHSLGEVRLLEGQITNGSLVCDGSKFENPGRITIQADRLRTKGAVLLRSGFVSKGEVRLLEAEIGGSLECNGGRFENPNGNAISADRLRCRGSIFIGSDFLAKGEVRLNAARIEGRLYADKGIIQNNGHIALFGDAIRVEGGAFFRHGFKSDGELRLLGADIGGNLEFDGSRFNNPGGNAISADELRTKGSLFMRDGFHSTGQVRLIGARIDGGTIDFDGAKFENPGGVALNAELLRASGSAYLRKGFSSDGEVRFFGAQIAGNLECLNCSFSNPGRDAFVAQGMHVAGIFQWRKMKTRPDGVVNLVNAHVTTFADDPSGWPAEDELALDGFEYESISNASPTDAQERENWLRLLGQEYFSVQPYEHLANILRRTGKEHEARKIAIAKKRALRSHGGLSNLAKAWNWFLDVTVSYGYRPLRVVFIFIVPLIVVGALVFQAAFTQGSMLPSGATSDASSTSEDQISELYPSFDAIAYSADLFIPVIDFKMADLWVPDTSSIAGRRLRIYSWVHISAGWIFSTLAVVAVAGLLRKD